MEIRLHCKKKSQLDFETKLNDILSIESMNQS